MKNKKYVYKIEGNNCYIYLEQRNGSIHEILIDSKDLDRVINYKYKWGVHFDPHTNSFYVKATLYNGAQETPKYKNVYLHRFLLNVEDENILVDHKTNNTLDNRKKNLRKSTSGNNSKNRKSKNSNNTSGYRNVSWLNGFWRVQLQINGKNNLFPEKFEKANTAGLFAENMRRKYYNEYSGQN